MLVSRGQKRQRNDVKILQTNLKSKEYLIYCRFLVAGVIDIEDRYIHYTVYQKVGNKEFPRAKIIPYGCSLILPITFVLNGLFRNINITLIVFLESHFNCIIVNKKLNFIPFVSVVDLSQRTVIFFGKSLKIF